MREFFKMFFASLLSMVVAGILMLILTISIIVGISKSVTEKEKKSGNILVIDLSNKIHEQGQTNAFAAFNKGNDYEPGLYDLGKAISHAKNDENIKGILLKVGSTANGWATMQQLRMAIEDFKTSKKFIYAYGEEISQKCYFTATVADSIYLNPAGGIELKGFATILAYFKGALDKLELQPEIFYAGKFKSATEPFRAEKISDPNREQIQGFQSGMWDEFLKAASQYMQMSKEQVNELAQKGSIQFPSDAVKNKMVAGLLYWDEMETKLKAKIDPNGKEKIKYINIEEYAMNSKFDDKMNSNKIAVLFAEGEIKDGEQNNENEIASKTICEEIKKIRENDNIKALVLRVNSPGGSAYASEIILRELLLLKAKKPLIVSMGDYAASGGYYISSHADSIFALPNTITGSIGVFAMMFNIDKMMKNKLGVTFDEVKNAPYADLPANFRPLNADEGKRVQNQIDTIYSLFKNHVATGRHITPEQVEEIAQGRVWTGTDAKKKGLADDIGGIGRAIKSAATMAKLTDYKVVTYPEPTDKLSMILKKIKSNTNTSIAIQAALKEELGAEYDIYAQIKSLKEMNGKVLMTMPYLLKVN